jgi:hypothetical protein
VLGKAQVLEKLLVQEKVLEKVLEKVQVQLLV